MHIDHAPSVLFLAFAIAACGGAPEPVRWTLKRRTPDQGTLALVGPRDPQALKQAERIIQEHCRGPSTIVEESEVVVGVDNFSTEAQGTSRGGAQRSATASTRNATEWHLRYQCGR